MSENRSKFIRPGPSRHLPLHVEPQLPQLVKKKKNARPKGLSEHGPDVHVLANSLVRTWIGLESA